MKMWEAVKAFEEGKEVQRFGEISREWINVSANHGFKKHLRYRIKPAKPRVIHYPQNLAGQFSAIELTDAVKEALKAAGIEYDE